MVFVEKCCLCNLNRQYMIGIVRPMGDMAYDFIFILSHNLFIANICIKYTATH